MQMRRRRILYYLTPASRNPFEQWFERLRDTKVQALITARIERLRQGHRGDYKRLDNNLYELRIHYGAGYRIYFGVFRNNVVILLCGGTKGTQHRDIARAQNYWNEFRSNADEQ